MKKVLSIILVLALIASAACAVVFNGQKNDLQKQNETLTADIAAVKADLETAKADAEAAAAAAKTAAEAAAAEAATAQETAVAAAKAEAEEAAATAAKTAAETAAADLEAAVAAAKAEAEEAAKTAAETAAADKAAAVAAIQAELDAVNAALESAKANEGKKDTIVLFTSDVHCGIDQGFGYEGLALVKAQLANDYNVLLVDNGDSIQGEPIGTMTKGEAIIDLMNAAGYDLATMGNHEFDYGMDIFLGLAEKAEFPYVSANFTHNGEAVFAPYIIKDVEGMKIAFVGVTTPKTFTSSTPNYFQDENGNYVYGFAEDDTGAALYAAVQTAVDAAKAEGANYVVVMAHLGIEEECSPWTSSELILNTTGIDALLDGHSHSVLEAEVIKNKEGKDVLMAACGTKLENIGYLKISADGKLETGLFTYDASMATALENATTALNEKLAEVVAKTDVALIIYDPATGARVIRNTETNLGHLVADAYKDQTGADVAVVNGGGIRADIPAGDITLEQIMTCHPFGNSLCMKETTGQHILDALEWTARNVPDQNGGFLHVAGLTYEIHSYIPSSCTNDDKGNFTGVTGEYRVKNVTVNGEPLDLEKTYTIASHNFLLKSGGDGTNMFMADPLLLDEIKLDYQVVIDYIVGTLNGVVGEEYAEMYPVERIIIIPEAPVAEEPAAETETPNVVGTWTLSAITKGEKVINPAMMGLSITLIINEDGTCTMQQSGQEDVVGTWTQNGAELVVNEEAMTFVDGTLTALEESMGATLVYTVAE
ncbi:MAG: bifunctional metallophosphatase/5'-nucleotidase [Clostridia bacterium]|nr:bifunctional metallophosphatase/5'-nucleotidase [Clostridia bacterium]